MNTAGVSEPPGLWLRGQRIAAGLTQEDLAERSGVSVRTIADMERGRTRRPYPSSVRALIRALGLPDATGTELVARYRAPGDEPALAALAALPTATAAAETAEARRSPPSPGSCPLPCRTSPAGPANCGCSTPCSATPAGAARAS